MTEADLEVAIADLIEGIPGLLWHACGDSRACRGTPGLPDLIIAGPRGHILRELKSADGGTTVWQELWGWTLLKGWHGLAGCPPRPWAVWRPADLENGTIERELRELA